MALFFPALGLVFCGRLGQFLLSRRHISFNDNHPPFPKKRVISHDFLPCSKNVSFKGKGRKCGKSTRIYQQESKMMICGTLPPPCHGVCFPNCARKEMNFLGLRQES
jgi:hypothetical protein